MDELESRVPRGALSALCHVPASVLSHQSLCSVHRLVRAQAVQNLGGQRETGAVLAGQLRRAGAERVDAHAIDELQGAAGPGRIADAEDRADVGVSTGLTSCRRPSFLPLPRGVRMAS